MSHTVQRIAARHALVAGPHGLGEGLAAPAHYAGQGVGREPEGVDETGHLVPITDKIKALRKGLGLEEIPKTVLKDEEGLKQAQYIMEQTRLLMIIKED